MWTRRITGAVAGVGMALAGSTAAFAQNAGQLVAQVVAAELQPECKAGSRLTIAPDAVQRNGDGTYTAYRYAFSCQWEFATHPYCGARACHVRTYAVDGASVRLIGERLE